MAALTIENTLRPCLVGSDKKKCLFHGFWQTSDIYAPSPLKGGHNGGVVAGPVALVETEDGDIIKVEPALITFVDRKIEEYSFEEEKEEIDFIVKLEDALNNSGLEYELKRLPDLGPSVYVLGIDGTEAYIVA